MNIKQSSRLSFTRSPQSSVPGRSSVAHILDQEPENSEEAIRKTSQDLAVDESLSRNTYNGRLEMAAAQAADNSNGEDGDDIDDDDADSIVANNDGSSNKGHAGSGEAEEGERSRKHRKYSTMDKQMRIEVCMKKRDNPKMTQKELASWMKETHNKTVSQATICNTLKRSVQYLEEAQGAGSGHTHGPIIPNANSKIVRPVMYPSVERELFEWVRDYKDIPGQEMKEKAQEILDELHPNHPAFKFTEVWLRAFARRHGIPLEVRALPKKHVVVWPTTTEATAATPTATSSTTPTGNNTVAARALDKGKGRAVDVFVAGRSDDGEGSSLHGEGSGRGSFTRGAPAAIAENEEEFPEVSSGEALKILYKLECFWTQQDGGAYQQYLSDVDKMKSDVWLTRRKKLLKRKAKDGQVVKDQEAKAAEIVTSSAASTLSPPSSTLATTSVARDLELLRSYAVAAAQTASL